MKTYHLLIDTSTSYCLLGLQEVGGPLLTLEFPHENLLSKTLLPSIQDLLQGVGATIQQIKKIYIGIGPGSYTGTRVGVSVGKTLGFALQIPAIGFCSLLTFLANPPPGRFACLLPAQSGQIFLCEGVVENGIGLQSACELLSPQEISYRLQTSHTIIDAKQTSIIPSLTALSPFLPNLHEEQNLQLLYLNHIPT